MAFNKNEKHRPLGRNGILLVMLILGSLSSNASAESASNEELTRGKRIFNHYCAACHGVTGRGDGPNAPYLDPLPRDLSSERFLRRLTDLYLNKVIQSGGNSVSKSTLMPAYGKTLSQQEVGDIIAYIRTLPQKRRAETSPASPESLGEEMVANFGCLGCHRIAGRKNGKVGPNLNALGSKVKKRWLFGFLKSPKTIRPLGYVPLSRSRMPDFRLSNAEVRALTTYLLTRRDGISNRRQKTLQLDSAMIRQGEKLIKEKYGCLACHNLQGEGGKVGPDLSFAGRRLKSSWVIRWLLDTQSLQPGSPMPNLGLSKKEAVAIAGYLESLAEKTNGKEKREKVAAPTFREDQSAEGEKLFSDLGCGTCHSEIKGDEKPIAPDLTYVGDKLKRSWALGYLKEPTSIRPWLKARMPDFQFTEEEASAITKYLMTLRDKNASQLPAKLLASMKPSEVMVKAGLRLASKDYFDCMSCHPVGDKKPDRPSEEWAPNLALAHKRLNSEWIIRWLQDPQKIQPGTKMPSYFADDKSGPVNVLNGDEDKQMIALRDYLLSLGQIRRGE